jgi:hypothetical protein
MQLTHARLKHTVMSPFISHREIHIQNNQPEITSSHTATPLNYRTAVPADPIFAYHKFPEVYHGQGISKAAFSGGERRSRGREGHNI